MPVTHAPGGRQMAMGATLVAGGAIVRTWAPNARDVFLVAGAAPLAAAEAPGWQPAEADRLVPLGDGTWAGMAPGLAEGEPYLFWVRGPVGGSEGFKRDPYARELGTIPPFPNAPCIARDPATYPWHDAEWHPPPFHRLVIYQLHVGVFWRVDANGIDRRQEYGRFLDLAGRLPYLRDLGVNAIQLLPIQEYDQDRGLGYAGLDYFSPEMAYQVEDPLEVGRHLAVVNELLAEHGQPPLTLAQLLPGPNQLKCVVDLCHLHGISVIFDVVYNHAGGDFGDRSLWFYDRQPWVDANRSLYFTDKGWAGGMVFAYWQAPVRQFLIDNAMFLLGEYRIDGLRYDEVTVIHDHGGDEFCRNLTDTLRFVRPGALQIAEYWAGDRAYAITPTGKGGLGFDAELDDGFREAVRAALRQAAGGAQARISALDAVRDSLLGPAGFADRWRAVRHLENHDVVLWDVWDRVPRDLRVARLGDTLEEGSWYARSRSRVATLLLLTAPGTPMLFMGQEILETKPWSDDVRNWPEFLIDWDRLHTDRHKADFHRFVRDLLAIRQGLPGLCGEGARVSQGHVDDRVLVLHRWVEGEGKDVVVVVSLNEGTLHDYVIDMPAPGAWREVLNSDVYDHFPNPLAAGNGSGVWADGPPGSSYPQTARVTIPANGGLVLVRG